MTERVFVTTIPDCDLCATQGVSRPAYADARLPRVGSWANVCASHFLDLGCALGTGHGQILMTRDEWAKHVNDEGNQQK